MGGGGGLLQPSPFDDRFRKVFFDLALPGDWFVIHAVGVNVMVSTVSLQVPTIFLQELYQVSAFHDLPPSVYYTH